MQSTVWNSGLKYRRRTKRVTVHDKPFCKLTVKHAFGDIDSCETAFITAMIIMIKPLPKSVVSDHRSFAQGLEEELISHRHATDFVWIHLVAANKEPLEPMSSDGVVVQLKLSNILIH